MGIFDLFSKKGLPLHDAVTRGDVGLLRAALKKTRDVDATDEKGLTALQLACKMLDPNLSYVEVKKWIKDPDQEDDVAIIYELMRALLEHGADPSRLYPAGPSGYQLCMLKIAIERSTEVAILLVLAGADVNYEDSLGWSPLVWARKYASEGFVEFLLEHGARENAESLKLKREIEEYEAYVASLNPKDDLRVERPTEELEGSKIIDWVLKPVYALVGDKKHKLNEIRLTKGQAAAYLAELVEGEVNNGGFDQYFFNNSGNYAQLATGALKYLGAVRKAELLTEALQVFPGGVCPSDRKQRAEVMEKIEEESEDKWDELDDRFYDAKENIYNLIKAHIDQHPEEYFKA